MLIKLTKILTFALTTLFLSSCADHLELNEKIMVQVAAIDFVDGLYNVSAEYYTGASTNVQSDNLKTEQVIIKGTGSSLVHALKEAEFNSGKPLIFGECQVIVLGRGAIESDLLEIMEVFSFPYESYPYVVFVGTDGLAEDILKIKYKGETLNMRKINSIMENSYRIGLSPLTRLQDLLADVSTKNNSTYLPKIEIKFTDTSLTDDGNELFLVGGMIVKDGKLVGDCSNSESAGLFLLSGEGPTTTVTVPFENRSTLVTLHNIKIKLEPHFLNERLTIVVDFHADAEYMESNVTKATIEQAKIVEEKINLAVKERLEDAAKNIIIRYGADVISLESIIRNKNYTLWKKIENEYDEYLTNAEFVITAQSLINRYGIPE